PITLFNSLDPTSGTSSCNVVLNAGNTGSASFTVVATVGGYYSAPYADGTIELATPNGSFITGGGYVNVTSSSGTRKAESGTRMNFGYNAKTTKSGKNYQGHVNVIFRAGGRTYQIKSTAIDTL